VTPGGTRPNTRLELAPPLVAEWHL